MDGAHRVAYRIFRGPIPFGWVVAQSCGDLACINPAHLFTAAMPRPRQSGGRTADRNIYSSPEWQRARDAALLRDGHRCTVARFFAGDCTDVLHVHHIVPLVDGGAPFALKNLGTTCSRHHRMWEVLRQEIARNLSDDLYHRVTCRHQHRSSEARRQCEARMARQRERSIAA